MRMRLYSESLSLSELDNNRPNKYETNVDGDDLLALAINIMILAVAVSFLPLLYSTRKWQKIDNSNPCFHTTSFLL
jgi:hypothetical protein